MDLSKLREPFKAADIEWRVQRSGEKNSKPWAMVLAYVTNRAIMDRLDEVCGPENWQNHFDKGPDGGILCGLSIKVGGQWVTKWDAAANTEVFIDKKPDVDTNIKGGISASMKRAGVQWGIGRYLYDLDIGFANISPNGKHKSKTKEGTWFNWDQPELPKWALPGGSESDKPEVTTGVEDLQNTRLIEGWIKTAKDEIGHGRLKGEWWAEFGDKIKEDCTEAGAKMVYEAVIK